MFGYINPDRPYLFKKDEVLYQAVYCGLCKSIGGECGQFARTSLTYDIAFMSAFMHNVMQVDFDVTPQRCVVHPFKRRPMAKVDKLTRLLGAINCVMAYYKLLDDKADGDKKGALAVLYKKGCKRALKKYPEAVEIVERNTKAQSELEKSGCDIIDAACEPSALMIKELSRYVLKDYATEYTDGLCYAVGKWIYLIDALDDYDKDVKKGAYNVLYNYCKKPSKQEAIEAFGDELKFILDSLFADMRFNLSQIKFYYNHDLTDNIILRGIPLKSRRVFYGADKKENNYEQTQS